MSKTPTKAEWDTLKEATKGTPVYLVGKEGAQELNTWEHMTNDPSAASELLCTIKGGVMKVIYVK